MTRRPDALRAIEPDAGLSGHYNIAASPRLCVGADSWRGRCRDCRYQAFILMPLSEMRHVKRA